MRPGSNNHSLALRLFPFLRWLPIDRGVVVTDLLAGLTVALVIVPKAMAYAQLAGLPPYYGLYAAFIPVIVGVPMRNLEHWRVFADGMAQECPVDSAYVRRWLLMRRILPETWRQRIPYSIVSLPACKSLR